ncbi:MAG TPA: hypothetical protein VHL59_17760 [Thermoanaerobaculia bacterium]|nr:hypothetical protein [Thermoanaerobaculia bacterium]
MRTKRWIGTSIPHAESERLIVGSPAAIAFREWIVKQQGRRSTVAERFGEDRRDRFEPLDAEPARKVAGREDVATELHLMELDRRSGPQLVAIEAGAGGQAPSEQASLL